MAELSDNVFDSGLSYISDNTENLYILNDDPVLTWANIAAYSIGVKSTPSIAAPADRTGGGRQITVSAINDGVVNSTDTASHWALTDDSNSEIIASGALDSTQLLNNGDFFTTNEFEIGIPDPA